MQLSNEFSATAQRERQYALVLAGGVSLGAYQAGAFASLDRRAWKLTAISGASVGAINAALIAGNDPEHRLRALEKFWHCDAVSLSNGMIDVELSQGSMELRHLECWGTQFAHGCSACRTNSSHGYRA